MGFPLYRGFWKSQIPNYQIFGYNDALLQKISVSAVIMKELLMITFIVLLL